MTQDEVIKLAAEAGFGNYAYEATGIFERFAAMIAAAEREKCTGTQEFVTLPREVVELAIEAIGDAKHKIEFDAIDALIAALKQPPTTEQSSAVEQPQVEQEPVARVVGTGHLGGHFDWCKPDSQDYLPPGALLYTHPQPKREPVGEAGPMPGADGFTMACFRASDVSVGTELYTRPQPEREPLTDEEIDKLCPQFDDPMRREMWIIGFKAAHNIK